MYKNEIGNKYGKLLVIEDAGTDSTKHKLWKCRCECGQEIIVRGSRLRSGEKQDCGCIKKHGFIDETGNRYGRLVVLEIDTNSKTKDRDILWKCKCDCGNYTTVRSGDLRQGKTKSCGCLMNESRGQTVVVDEVGNHYGNLTVQKRVFDNDQTGVYWECLCSCGNTVIVKGSKLRQGQVKSCGCLQSYGESEIQRLLQLYNVPYKKEYCFKDFVTQNNGHPRFDFAIFNDQGLIFLLEYQGEQHLINKGDFGKYQREVTDSLKKAYCQKNNIPLYEITYKDNIEEKLISLLKKFEI